MESESKIEDKKGLKTPEDSQESNAVKTHDPSTNGYNTEPSKDLRDKKTYNSAKSGSSSDDTLCRNTKPQEAQLPPRNVESSTKLNSSSIHEPQKFMNTPEWASMSYSEKSTFLFFLQAGVSEEEAISIIDEVRQERGIPELTKQHRETESTQEHSKDVISKDGEKVKEFSKESSIDVTKMSDVVLVSSSSDEESDHESSNPNSSECKQSATPKSDGASLKSKWVRHSDCKHTLDELKKMAQQILTKKFRAQFLYRTYCKGVDAKEQMKFFLNMDASKPRVELRKMSKILPKNLRTKFYCEAMRRNNPNALMRKFMSAPQNQQWLLCKKLKLSNTKLLFKLFQRPGEKSGNPVTRPLKEWFNIFLQEGSVDEAIGKVKKLILHGAVTDENTAGESAPNAVESVNQSPGRVSHNEEITLRRQLGRKSRTRRNKKFQQLNEDQMKVYNSWLEQGLSHQDALTIVLRFPGDRRSARMNVCAWGKCDKHPQQKFSKSEKTVSKAQPSANGTHPSVSSETTQFKKPIFDRIPVPSIVLDTSSPPKAGLPLEQQAKVPSVIKNGKSISPFTPHGAIIQSKIPPTVKHSPTLAMSSQGLRVPQKSEFVDKSEPLKPTQLPKQNPSTTETLHLCIVPSGYPEERFSDEEFKAIENSIQMAISGISDDRMKPIFKKQFRNKDKYEMICQDQLAKKWLHKYVACMYPVVPLKIIPAKFTKIAARAVLPLCKNDTKKILSILARQNEGLNVSQWEVVGRSDTSENTSLKLLVDQESANVLKNCSQVGFMMGIANIDIEDPKQMSSKINCGKPGTGQVLGASRSTARRMSQADKVASTSNSDFQNIQKEQQPPSGNKQRHTIREPSKHIGSHSKLHADTSEKHLPKKPDRNSQGPHKNRYVGRPQSHEYRDNREQDESDPMGYTIPSPSQQNIEEPNEGMRGGAGYPPNFFQPPDCGPMNEPWYNPNCLVPFIRPQGFVRPPRYAHPPGMPPRFAFPPFMPPRFAHPPGMPPRFTHPPGMPPRFPHPPGMPPRFPHPLGNPARFARPPGMPPRFGPPLGMPPMFAQCGAPPSDGFPPERPNQLEQVTEKSAPRSPSPDFDELLKNARSRLNLPDEPAQTKSTDTQKTSSSEHLKQGHSHRSSETQPIRRNSTRFNERNNSSRRIPATSGSNKRNHSPEGSLYSSRSRNRKRSRSSPPLKRNWSTKSSRWN